MRIAVGERAARIGCRYSARPRMVTAFFRAALDVSDEAAVADAMARGARRIVTAAFTDDAAKSADRR